MRNKAHHPFLAGTHWFIAAMISWGIALFEYLPREPLRWNYLWAGVCLMGAFYFIFKG